MTTKLYIHVATMGDWEKSLDSLFDKVLLSGLYSFVDKTYVCFVGDGRIETVAGFYPGKTLSILPMGDLGLYEFPTLSEVHARAYGGISVYAHLKGISKTRSHWDSNKEFYKEAFGIYRLDDLWFNEHCWKLYMEYFNILRHEDCREALKTHDVCGVHWRDEPFPHYSGNFWWANDDYIKTLESPQEFADNHPDYVDPMGSRRSLAEFWVGSGNPKHKVLFNSAQDLYAKPMLPHLYRPAKLF